jgi:hypothetical protein
MELSKFEQSIMEKAKGSEFEFVLKKAKEQDPEAIVILRSKGFQRRLFYHINKSSRTPEQVMKSILYKAGAAIAIVLFERVLTAILKGKPAWS